MRGSAPSTCTDFENAQPSASRTLRRRHNLGHQSVKELCRRRVAIDFFRSSKGTSGEQQLQRIALAAQCLGQFTGDTTDQFDFRRCACRTFTHQPREFLVRLPADKWPHDPPTLLIADKPTRLREDRQKPTNRRWCRFANPSAQRADPPLPPHPEPASSQGDASPAVCSRHTAIPCAREKHRRLRFQRIDAVHRSLRRRLLRGRPACTCRLAKVRRCYLPLRFE